MKDEAYRIAMAKRGCCLVCSRPVLYTSTKAEERDWTLNPENMYPYHIKCLDEVSNEED